MNKVLVNDHEKENKAISNNNNNNRLITRKVSPTKLSMSSSGTQNVTMTIYDLDDGEEDDNTQKKRQKFIDDLKCTFSSSFNHSAMLNNSDDLIFDESDNNFYGLPNIAKDMLAKLRNINKLYDWQDELLTIMLKKYNDLKLNSGPVREFNLLYLSPTSGGKTLVAELLMLHCMLIRKKNCIFIMPFVSIVQEKVRLMQPFGDNLNFHVEEYAGVKGTLPPIKRQQSRNKQTLYICTIEKAHSLINSLIENDRLGKEIGMVVADEMHMIGDGSRGAIYEMVLAKAKYCAKINPEPIPLQIVATTATLQNKAQLAKFLDAFLFERHFRPVDLKEYIKLDKQVFEVNKSRTGNDDICKPIREIQMKGYTNELKRDDPDGLVELVKEVIPNESCLVFCSSKKNCENLAKLLCSYLPSEFKQHKRDLKLKLFNELKEENNNNICPVLRLSIQFGIAYHHSGLTTEERQLIEQAFRDGVLSLLTCTSTLAAGVNLPAKRVIIRSPYVARDFISANQYKQMIGRAGRAGLIDSGGESILIFSPMDKAKVLELVSGPMKRCDSSFQGNDSKAIRLLVLSLVGLNLTQYGQQILKFFEETLFYLQQVEQQDSLYDTPPSSNSSKTTIPEQFDPIYEALDYLINNKLISTKLPDDLNFDDDLKKKYFFSRLEITKLGMASIKGNLDLDLVSQLYADLKLGLKTIVLSNCLHLLYLCTPYELANSINNIDYDTYARKYSNLSEDEVKCAHIIGVPEDYIQKRRFQSKPTGKKVDENVIRRFYITLIIYELWKTNNAVWQVAGEFQLERGFIQNIVQSAASFTSNVLHFCEHLDEFWAYKNLLQEFIKRLQHNCSSTDLIPLLELENVRSARAKQLFNAGFKTIQQIASTKPIEMSEKIKNLTLGASKKIITSAKRIIKEKLELLQAEADNLIIQMSEELQIVD